jgi:kynureninase
MNHILTEEASNLDREASEAAKIRSRFPRGDIVAAAGHSLSRPCLKAAELIQGVFDKVNGELHGVHFPSGEGLEKQSKDSDYAFKLHLHKPTCKTLSELLGCSPEDVNLGNGLSDDLIRLVETHIHLEVFGKRRRIMCLTRDFNSDLTIVRSFVLKAVVNALISVRPVYLGGGLDTSSREEYQRLSAIFLDAMISEDTQFEEISSSFLVEIPTAPGSGLYDHETILGLVKQHSGELAGAVLPGVVFHTSQLLDVGRINGALLEEGVCCVWDFAHSIGNVQHAAEKDGVLAAAGCGYKHLNGLPGGPGFIYQNSKAIARMYASTTSSEANRGGHPIVRPTPMSGWLSHGKSNPFDAFPVIDRFHAATLQPIESIQRSRASNPEVLALKVLMANLEVVADFGVRATMALKESLTCYLFKALDIFFSEEIEKGIFTYITPRKEGQRGATICFSISGANARAIETAVVTDKHGLGRKFEIDVRPAARKGDSDTFRLTAHYCHMGFTDTADLAYCLHECYIREKD